MADIHGVPFLDIDRPPSSDGTVEGNLVANNNCDPASAVAEAWRSAAAYQSPRPGRYSSVSERQAAYRTESTAVSRQSSFNMKLRRKFNNENSGGVAAGYRPLLHQRCRLLKKWLMRHRDTPYPTGMDKRLLAERCNMTVTQVSNWFANARRRLKRTVVDPQMSWAGRIRLYDSCVVGKQEPLDVSSADDDDDDEDSDEVTGGQLFGPARKPSSLSDCTNDDDVDDDDDDDSKASTSSSTHNEEQSLMRSFGISVGYLDGRQLSAEAVCLAEPRPKSLQSTTFIRRSEIVRGASATGRESAADRSAHPVRLPSTNDAHWPLLTAVVRRAEPTALDGRVVGSNFPGRCLAKPGGGPHTSYAAVFVPLLRTATTTTSAIDASDEPEDLSVRTGARHVTVVDNSTTQTITTDGHFQRAELTGRANAVNLGLCDQQNTTTGSSEDLFWKEVSAALALTTMAASRSSRRLQASSSATSLPVTS